jgi:hypothetical protein
MQDLQILLNIIKSQRLKNEILDKKHEHNLLDKFEYLLEHSDNVNDEFMANALYGNLYITGKYNVLKYRVKERLLNKIFNYASNHFNLKSRVGSLHIIGKNYTIGMILMEFVQRDLAIDIFERTLELAVKYQHTPFVILILKQLLYHYSFISPDKRKMENIMMLREKYQEIYNAEQFAENCNAEISYFYVTKKSGLDKDQLSRFGEMINDLIKLQEKYSSYVVNLVSFDLAAFYYLYVQDYDRVIKISKSAVTYFKELQFEEKLGMLQSLNYIALASLYQGLYPDADDYISRGFSIVTDGSRYWFRQNGIYFLSSVLQQNYDRMYEICSKVVSHKKLKSFSVEEEQWYIREAYVQFLARMGKVSPVTVAVQQTRPFVLSRFLNSVPFHSKDKQGQNISIIVVQILFLILDRKYNAVIDKMEGLNQYNYRHLKNDETFRSNCFIKMLLLMVKADFHPVRTVTYTSDLHKKLLSKKFVSNENSAHIEIIPYDQLWNVVLELLHRNN